MVVEDSIDRAHQAQLGMLAFTSGPNRELSPSDRRPFGYVLASRILPSGGEIPAAAITECRLEPEICLILGRDLAGEDVDPAAAREAVSAVAPAFEVVEVRRAAQRTPLPVRVADGINNWGMVVGIPVEPPEADLCTTVVSTQCDTAPPEVVQLAPDQLDDPYLSLARLCASLSRVGRGVKVGAHVLTGAFSVHPARPGQMWCARFSGLGEVRIGLAP
jgi:2-keto-4-pentenoate hydratase